MLKPPRETKLDLVLRKHQIHRPVEGDAELSRPTGHLRQVDRSPEKLGREAGQPDAKYLRHPRAAAQRGQ